MSLTFCVLFTVVILQALRQGMVEGSSGLFNVVPVSLNTTLGTDVVFSCGTTDSSLNFIWSYANHILATQTYEQLVTGGVLSKVLVRALVEYNESSFTCYLLNGTKTLSYKEALLLIQGIPAKVVDFKIIEQDPCSTSLSWISPYSLAGVPILGYNISVTTGHVPLMSLLVNTTNYKFVPVVFNWTYTIETSAVNEVGQGIGTSLTASVMKNIKLNDTRLQNYYWNEKEWELVFNIIGLCINSSIDNTQFKICESITNCSTISLNNTQYINYTTTLSSTVIMTAKLSLPENRFLTLSFIIQYSNGQEMESSLFTINTHDIQNISVTDIDRGKVCILLTYRYNSKAIGAYIVLIHNESDTNVTKEIYLNMSMCCESETCLTGLSSGNYTLYIYDLESQSGPVINDNKVPAVILTSLEVPGIIPTTTTKAMDIIRSTSTNTPQYTETSLVLSSILTAVPAYMYTLFSSYSIPLITMETTSMTHSVTTTMTISSTINVNSIIIITVGGCVFVLLILSILLSVVLTYIYYISVQHKGGTTLPGVEVINTISNVTINNEEPPPIPEYLEMEQCPAYGTINHKWRDHR